MPNFGAYAASKAAVTSFGEMLHAELRGDGVTVTVLCPGDVPTEFAATAGVESAQQRIPGALSISAPDCARAALAGLEAGRRQVIPKPAVRLLYRIGQYAPRSIWLPLARRLMA
jgi:short-subunit dehydrogenase